MKYLIVIVRHRSNGDSLIFAAVRSWIQDVPSKVYIYGGDKNYGFEYAMLERASNIVFTNQFPTFDDETHLILLRPGQYLNYQLLPQDHRSIIDRDTYHKIGFEALLGRPIVTDQYSKVILELTTSNAILN